MAWPACAGSAARAGAQQARTTNAISVTRRTWADTVAAPRVDCSVRIGAVAKAFVGIGSNLGEPERQIAEAIALLGAEEGIEVVAVSSLRETEPVGYRDQPSFLNGAVALETGLSPRELLERLLAIELRLGRVRGEGPRFGPRTIDLDLLLYDDETVDEPGLTVPHPRLAERRFALEPLAEHDPALEIPEAGPVRALLASARS